MVLVHLVQPARQFVQTFEVALKKVPEAQTVQSVFAVLIGPFVQVHSFVVVLRKKFAVKHAVQKVELTQVLHPVGQAMHVVPDKKKPSAQVVAVRAPETEPKSAGCFCGEVSAGWFGRSTEASLLLRMPFLSSSDQSENLLCDKSTLGSLNPFIKASVASQFWKRVLNSVVEL